MSDVTLGGNIRRLRIAAGFKTQGALAKALSVPQPQVSDWENDRYDMLDTKTLMRLGKELKVSMDRIVEGLDVGYDLACQSGTGRSSPHLSKGDAVDPASAHRIAELERERDELQRRVQQFQKAASQFAKIAVAGAEGDQATGTTPGPRRRR